MREIEVFADVWCPFAHVGLRNVVAMRASESPPAPSLRIRAWPLELVNGEPLDVAKTARHIEELQAQCAPQLFAGFDPELFPRSSLPALAVAAAGYRAATEIGEAVSLALRDALFEHGRDISDPDVLADIARCQGAPTADAADHEAVRADWRAGQVRGVEGSPHFFCGEVDVFCPSLNIRNDDEGHVDVKHDLAALTAFMAACQQSSDGRSGHV